MSSARDVRKYAKRVEAEAKAARRPRKSTEDRLARYVNDPAGFAEALVDPETGKPFELYPAQRRFLEEAFTLNQEGRLPYPELVFSAPKKSGKTAMAAIALLYVVRVIGGRNAEGYTLANDLEQSVGRVFQAAVKIIDASPLLRGTAKTTTEKITFADGATITALASDYAGAAGSNPSITVFDELWAYTSERSRRLWDEMVPVPTRKVSVRLTVTYAGFEGESALLEGLYKRGLSAEQIASRLFRDEGLLMFWSHEPVAPWQTSEWLEQMRSQLRPSAFTRMILNQFTTGESSFIEMEWWDACVNQELTPVLEDTDLPICVGVDASVKRDSTAIVAVTGDFETSRVRLVSHRIFQPSPDDPLNFEAVEETVLDLARRFSVVTVLFDPYQFVSSAQRLEGAGIPMEEYPQTLDRLTATSSYLYELIKGRNLEVYPDREMRLAISCLPAATWIRVWRT